MGRGDEEVWVGSLAMTVIESQKFANDPGGYEDVELNRMQASSSPADKVQDVVVV